MIGHKLIIVLGFSVVVYQHSVVPKYFFLYSSDSINTKVSSIDYLLISRGEAFSQLRSYSAIKNTGWGFH